MTTESQEQSLPSHPKSGTFYNTGPSIVPWDIGFAFGPGGRILHTGPQSLLSVPTYGRLTQHDFQNPKIAVPPIYC